MIDWSRSIGNMMKNARMSFTSDNMMNMMMIFVSKMNNDINDERIRKKRSNKQQADLTNRQKQLVRASYDIKTRETDPKRSHHKSERKLNSARTRSFISYEIKSPRNVTSHFDLLIFHLDFVD